MRGGGAAGSAERGAREGPAAPRWAAPTRHPKPSAQCPAGALLRGAAGRGGRTRQPVRSWGPRAPAGLAQPRTPRRGWGLPVCDRDPTPQRAGGPGRGAGNGEADPGPLQRRGVPGVGDTGAVCSPGGGRAQTGRRECPGRPPPPHPGPGRTLTGAPAQLCLLGGASEGAQTGGGGTFFTSVTRKETVSSELGESGGERPHGAAGVGAGPAPLPLSPGSPQQVGRFRV